MTLNATLERISVLETPAKGNAAGKGKAMSTRTKVIASVIAVAGVIGALMARNLYRERTDASGL
ncbi:MAG: hypothetical protein KIT69_15385 [Propionibacteriaceae bacterium]|nr:hypothetical protein [Propionibacteriaceae bacterium]